MDRILVDESLRDFVVTDVMDDVSRRDDDSKPQNICDDNARELMGSFKLIINIFLNCTKFPVSSKVHQHIEMFSCIFFYFLKSEITIAEKMMKYRKK